MGTGGVHRRVTLCSIFGGDFWPFVRQCLLFVQPDLSIIAGRLWDGSAWMAFGREHCSGYELLSVLGFFCGARLSISDAALGTAFLPDHYCFHATGGPLTRFPLRSTTTSTRSAIVTNGIPLFIP